MHNLSKIGKVQLHYPSLESTNELAKELISKTKPISGTVIIADFQSKGKGQMGNNWESEPCKNVLLTVIIEPKLVIDDFFYLNKICCIAILETLSRYIDPKLIEIKWPNDILVKQKKISGILIENTISGENIQYAIIGIGINNQQSTFNENTNATSIYLETCTILTCKDVITRLLEHLTIWHNNLASKKYSLIDNVYLKFLYGYKKPFTYKFNNQIAIGQIQSIARDGVIHIITDHEERTFKFKEIEFILNS